MRALIIPTLLAASLAAGCASDEPGPGSPAQGEASGPPAGSTVARLDDSRVQGYAHAQKGVVLASVEVADDDDTWALIHQDGSVVNLTLDAFDSFGDVALGGDVLLVAGSLDGEYALHGLSPDTFEPLYAIPFEQDDDNMNAFSATGQYVVTYSNKYEGGGCENTQVYDTATGEAVSWELPDRSEELCPTPGPEGYLTLDGEDGVVIDIATGDVMDEPATWSATEGGADIEYTRGDIRWTFDPPLGGTRVEGVAHGAVVADSNGHTFTLLEEQSGDVLSTFDARGLGDYEECEFRSLLSVERLLLACETPGSSDTDLFLIAV